MPVKRLNFEFVNKNESVVDISAVNVVLGSQDA